MNIDSSFEAFYQKHQRKAVASLTKTSTTGYSSRKRSYNSAYQRNNHNNNNNNNNNNYNNGNPSISDSRVNEDTQRKKPVRSKTKRFYYRKKKQKISKYPKTRRKNDLKLDTKKSKDQGPKNSYAAKDNASRFVDDASGAKIGNSSMYRDYEIPVFQQYDWQSITYCRTETTTAVNEENARKMLLQGDDNVQFMRQASGPNSTVSMQSKVKFRERNKIIPKLRDIAVKRLAANCEFITSRHLQAIPKWVGCWDSVWFTILRNRMDNFRLFEMFAEFFSQEKTFSCHYRCTNEVSYSRASCRDILLEAVNIWAIKHRIETIGSNINFAEFFNNSISDVTTSYQQGLYKARYDRFLSLRLPEMEKTMVTYDQLRQIINVKNLVLLELHKLGNLVDDSFLQNMTVASRNGKLQNLLYLGLPKVDVSKKQIVEFIRNSNVFYMESSHEFEEWEIHKFQADGEDKRFKLIKMQNFVDDPVETKLDKILKKFNKYSSVVESVYSALYQEKNHILLDLQLEDHHFDHTGAKSITFETDSLWTCRKGTKSMIFSRRPIHGYMIKRYPSDSIQKDGVGEPRQVARRQNSAPKNRITNSSKSFFGLK